MGFNMFIREYQPSDCAEIIELFYNTVHTINSKDYTKEQLDVWATKNIDLKAWNKSFLKNYTIVAIEDNIIVGFGDISENGYLDRLYIHKDYQHQGIATQICNSLETHNCWKKITVHASITAKYFFENRGYHILKEQKVERLGIVLTNFIMEKHF